MEEGDKVLVCHHDWMPDGRVIKEPGVVNGLVPLENKDIAINVDILDDDGIKQGFMYVPTKNTDKDYYWIEAWNEKYKEEMKAQIMEDIKSGKIIDADQLADKARRAQQKGARPTRKNTRRTKPAGVRKTGGRTKRNP